MSKPLQEWKVLPHDKLKQVDDNILTVTGDIRMPLMGTTRGRSCATWLPR